MTQMVTMTLALLDQGGTAGCGWNRRQAECLGVPWPLTSGWKEAVIGREYRKQTIESFLSLKTKDTADHKRQRIHPLKDTREKVDAVPHVLREVGFWMAQMKDWSVDDWFEFHAGLTQLFDRIAAKQEQDS